MMILKAGMTGDTLVHIYMVPRSVKGGLGADHEEGGSRTAPTGV